MLITAHNADPMTRGPDTRIQTLEILQAQSDRLSAVRDQGSPLGYGYRAIEDVLGQTPAQVVAMLDALVEMGLANRQEQDRVGQCPGCDNTVLSSRAVCGSCSGWDMRTVDVLHHYRCGHVAPVAEFVDGLKYRCGRCSKILKHIGVDYGRPASHQECGTCSWSAPQAHIDLGCLSCGRTFSPEDARTRTVWSYAITVQGRLALQAGRIDDSDPAMLLAAEGGVYRFPVWRRDLARHLSLAGRRNRPVTVAMLRPTASGPSAASDEIAGVAARTTRATDVVAMRSDGTVMVLLPDTDREGAARFLERTQTLLEATADVPPIASCAETSTEGRETADRLLARASLRLTAAAVNGPDGVHN